MCAYRATQVCTIKRTIAGHIERKSLTYEAFHIHFYLMLFMTKPRLITEYCKRIFTLLLTVPQIGCFDRRNRVL
jgi:hypothetical protein